MLAPKTRRAIRKAAGDVAGGAHDAHFPIDVFQTGSGTSSNMNANEVIAALAARAGQRVHPNDDVNNGQSSNDVIPTRSRSARARGRRKAAAGAAAPAQDDRQARRELAKRPRPAARI
jgi:fumarate hydratase class II